MSKKSSEKRQLREAVAERREELRRLIYAALFLACHISGFFSSSNFAFNLI